MTARKSSEKEGEGGCVSIIINSTLIVPLLSTAKRHVNSSLYNIMIIIELLSRTLYTAHSPCQLLNARWGGCNFVISYSFRWFRLFDIHFCPFFFLPFYSFFGGISIANRSDASRTTAARRDPTPENGTAERNTGILILSFIYLVVVICISLELEFGAIWFEGEKSRKSLSLAVGFLNGIKNGIKMENWNG